MTLTEIKQAVDAGECVCWKNSAYKVIRDSLGQYLIAFRFGSRNANFIGLTHRDGVTMNGQESDFFISESIAEIDA